MPQVRGKGQSHIVWLQDQSLTSLALLRYDKFIFTYLLTYLRYAVGGKDYNRKYVFVYKTETRTTLLTAIPWPAVSVRTNRVITSQTMYRKAGNALRRMVSSRKNIVQYRTTIRLAIWKQNPATLLIMMNRSAFCTDSLSR